MFLIIQFSSVWISQEGYELVGGDVTRRCGLNYTFSGSAPVCVRITCPLPDEMPNTMISCTRGDDYGSVCTVSCQVIKSSTYLMLVKRLDKTVSFSLATKWNQVILQEYVVEMESFQEKILFVKVTNIWNHFFIFKIN